MLLACMIIVVIFYSSIMYHVESNYDPDTDFTSIPASLWWAIITITTVGYGDIVPTTYFGKILSVGFMAFGAFTFLIPIMSIVTKFMSLYITNIHGEAYGRSVGFF